MTFSVARLKQLRSCYAEGLLHDVLPFWLRHAVDHQYGGFFTCLERDGQVVDTDKAVWQQARFTWLLAHLFNQWENRTEWLTHATIGIEFIEKFARDPGDQRYWFLLTQRGEPLRKRRYSFSEAFVAIAFAEFSQATGQQVYADRAASVFRQFLTFSERPPKALEKTTATRPARSLAIPMISLVTAQVLRRTTNLVWADEIIDRAIETIVQLHMNDEYRCVLECVAPDGSLIDHFEGRTLNPGHAIEAAWFILAEAKQRNEPKLIEIGCRILDWMWQHGWDPEFGGILYFVDIEGRSVQEYWHDMKFWWPQNEALIATLFAFQLTGNAKYAEWHNQLFDWVMKHFPDPDEGEWFGYLHRDGRRSVTLKGNHWKGPFHIPRMQLVCTQLIDELLVDLDSEGP